MGQKTKLIFNEIIKKYEIIFIRGNHDRYIIEKLWEEDLPTLEGMDPYDPICKAIVENEKWTAEKVGEEGIEFIRKMVISHLGNRL